jgi:hypothetical protein
MMEILSRQSIVDDDVEQNDESQNIIQGLQNKTVSDDVGMKKADVTTNVCGETTIIDLGQDSSIQGGVELNNATPLEGSSVILGEQNIVQDGVTFIQDLLTLFDFKGSAKRTLCGIVLFKLSTFFSHVFAGP